MSPKVLSEDQIEQFIHCGYTKLEQAFPERQALGVKDFLWTKVEERGVKRDDKSTWTKPMVHLAEVYHNETFASCLTDRLSDAVEDLVGRGRWRDYGDKSIPWGWWPVNFSLGADQPWDVPSKGWHWDGIQFKHTVDAPDQGLLLLCMFSQTRPHGGGTLVAEGSHQLVARFLNDRPDGMNVGDAIKEIIPTHPWLRELTNSDDTTTTRVERFMHQTTVDDNGTRLKVVETTANPGDIYLCHPFLFHAASQNLSGEPRFMCNRTTPLRERMKFDRDHGDYSALEISIRMALRRQTVAS
jgi:hypothetical protein